MYRYNDISTLHLEVTTRCNASCPMCLRNISGGKTNPNLPICELTVEQVRLFLPPAFIRQLKRIYLCGNYGDPLAAKDTLEIFKYFRETHPEIHLTMFTNGSGRKTDWWTELGKIIDLCHFSVDGLEDTNAIYRRKTEFPKIMDNARAFMAGGGTAHWDYIVFRHNEHQIEEARARAKELGFEKITFKKTGRFFSYSKSQIKEAQEVLNNEGEVLYEIYPPQNPQYYNAALKKDREILEQYGSFEQYYDAVEIDCKTAKEKSAYVTAEGLVFPCCWTALRLYPWYSKPKSDPIWTMIEALEDGIDSLSLKSRSLESIINGPFFQKTLPESWEKESVSCGKLKVCAKTCGKSFDPFSEQFQNRGSQ